MSKEEKGESNGTERSGNKKLYLIIGVLAFLLVLTLGAVAGTLIAVQKQSSHGGPKNNANEAEESASAEAEKESGDEHGSEEKTFSLVALEPFIVNLQVKGSYVKATLQMKLKGKEDPKSIESKLPKIRDGVISILSSKSATDILTNEGKESLRQELKQSINSAFGSDKVVEIYFTEFIIQ